MRGFVVRVCSVALSQPAATYNMVLQNDENTSAVSSSCVIRLVYIPYVYALTAVEWVNVSTRGSQTRHSGT